MAKQHITIRLGILSKGFEMGLKKGAGAITSFRQKVFSLKGAVAGLVGALALKQVGGGLIKLVKMSAAAEELDSKFRAVFGDQSEDIQGWASRWSSAAGRSVHDTKEMLSSMQDLLVPMGLLPGASADISKRLTVLAEDVASFSNKEATDVMGDFQSALTGSGEVMKKYGVILSETAIKQELSNRGMDPSKATEQQKAIARLAIIMRSTTAAHGDVERTGDSLTNQWKALSATVFDLATSLGDSLAPMVREVVAVIRSVIPTGEGVGFAFMKMGVDGESMGKKLAHWLKEILFLFFNWDLHSKKLGIRMAEFFTHTWERAVNLWDNLKIFLSWFGRNWKEIFVNAGINAAVILGNTMDILKSFFTAFWDWVASGFTDSFNFSFKDVGRRLMKDTVALAEEKIEFKPLQLSDFKDQLNEVDRDIAQRRKEMEERAKGNKDKFAEFKEELNIDELFAQHAGQQGKDKAKDKKADDPEFAGKGSVKAAEISMRLRTQNDPMLKEQKMTNETLKAVNIGIATINKALGKGFPLIPSNLI